MSWDSLGFRPVASRWLHRPRHSDIFPSDRRGMIETWKRSSQPSCLIRDGSRCLASVCNKQWSADTEESPNYSRNANVSRCAEKSARIVAARCCWRASHDAERSSGSPRHSSLLSRYLAPTSRSEEDTPNIPDCRRSEVFRECIFSFEERSLLTLSR